MKAERLDSLIANAEILSGLWKRVQVQHFGPEWFSKLPDPESERDRRTYAQELATLDSPIALSDLRRQFRKVFVDAVPFPEFDVAVPTPRPWAQHALNMRTYVRDLSTALRDLQNALRHSRGFAKRMQSTAHAAQQIIHKQRQVAELLSLPAWQQSCMAFITSESATDAQTVQQLQTHVLPTPDLRGDFNALTETGQTQEERIQDIIYELSRMRSEYGYGADDDVAINVDPSIPNERLRGIAERTGIKVPTLVAPLTYFDVYNLLQNKIEEYQTILQTMKQIASLPLDVSRQRKQIALQKLLLQRLGPANMAARGAVDLKAIDDLKRLVKQGTNQKAVDDEADAFKAHMDFLAAMSGHAGAAFTSGDPHDMRRALAAVPMYTDVLDATTGTTRSASRFHPSQHLLSIGGIPDLTASLQKFDEAAAARPYAGAPDWVGPDLERRKVAFRGKLMFAQQGPAAAKAYFERNRVFSVPDVARLMRQFASGL